MLEEPHGWGAMSYDGEPREVQVGEVQKVQVCLKHTRVEMGVGSPPQGRGLYRVT